MASFKMTDSEKISIVTVLRHGEEIAEDEIEFISYLADRYNELVEQSVRTIDEFASILETFSFDVVIDDLEESYDIDFS
jgi:hypothetical protein